MRKFLLATSAAALALAFSGHAQAELAKIPVAATTVAPPETTTADGLVFSKDADQAKPMDKAAEPAASPAQAQPEAKPAEQAAPAMVTPTLSAEDAAVADRLRDLAENKLQQYVPHAQDRAGVLAFYRARNFAPIWIASGKPAPRAGAGIALSCKASRPTASIRRTTRRRASAMPIRPSSPPTSWR